MKSILKLTIALCIIIATAISISSCQRPITLTEDDQKLLTADISNDAKQIFSFIPSESGYSFETLCDLAPDYNTTSSERRDIVFNRIDTTVKGFFTYNGYINEAPTYPDEPEVLIAQSNYEYGCPNFITLLTEPIPAENISNDDYCAVIVQKLTDLELTFCTKDEVTLGKYTYTHLGFANQKNKYTFDGETIDVYFRIHDDRIVYVIEQENSSAPYLSIE